MERYLPRTSLLDVSLQFKFSFSWLELVGCGEEFVVIGELAIVCVGWFGLNSSDVW